MSDSIPGYSYGSAALPASPVTLADLRLLEKTLLFTDDDRAALRLAGEVLADQTDDVLDLWYGFVGSHPHLVASFAKPGGAPDGNYLAAVRQRFGQWIVDTCTRDYDQTWLDYQNEIAHRHYRTKKNHTDAVDAAAIVPLRYLIAFIYPITATMKSFLAKKGHTAEQVEQMHQAWFKSVTLQVVLWSRPYVADADF